MLLIPSNINASIPVVALALRKGAPLFGDEMRVSYYTSGVEFKKTIPVRVSPINRIYLDLADYSTLPDNWDGQDAIPPYEESISNSFHFLHRLPEYVLEKIGSDNVYPTNYGTIIIDLINEAEEKVSLELGRTKIGFYTSFDDGQNYSIEQVNFNSNYLPPDLLSAITKLYKEYIF